MNGIDQNKEQWLDRELYPFAFNRFQSSEGDIHYIDEGEGQPLVFLHGNPTWSFLYRNVIKELGSGYRCIAPDYLGFGLSDRPKNFSYKPRDQAKAVEQFLNHLDLEGVTLVMHDYGGPIGAYYALEHTERVKALVPINTFAWPLEYKLGIWFFSRMFGGPVGRFLINNFNFFSGFLMRIGTGAHKYLPATTDELPENVHNHYQVPASDSVTKQASNTFARELLGSSKWFRELWDRREELKEKPGLIIWGMKDPAFGESEIEKWREMMNVQQIKRYRDGNHFLPETHGGEIAREIADFLSR